MNGPLDGEFEKFNAMFLPSCGGKGVFTCRRLPDGETILSASILLFTAVEVIRGGLQRMPWMDGWKAFD